ncbi:Gfo/Idh/MocA family protein [Pseudaestuariivita sp.]|uniref:Gfo/Idh/MocA family protein n=1 Tax=Pseudaestuariivita sp. TaxID=2211669 RepID=UPI004058D08F
MSLRVAIAGFGYFSQLHLAAWQSDPRVEVVGICDPDAGQRALAAEQGLAAFATVEELMAGGCDVLDIVTPPPTHAGIIRAALGQVPLIVCQKPFCDAMEVSRAVIAEAEEVGTTLVIHENFRFQPWYRQIRDLLEAETLGTVYQARFALRPGDGQGERAYLDRQPVFQTMERFLVQETAIHFVDTFRWLFGDIAYVHADLRQLNPVIAGEDAGVLTLDHVSGVRSVFDGNRLVDHVAEDQRLTMGEMEIEGSAGVLRLDGAGRLWTRRMGEMALKPLEDTYATDRTVFGGGCVAHLIRHVADHVLEGAPIENEAREYMHVMRACELAYVSAAEHRRMDMETGT